MESAEEEEPTKQYSKVVQRAIERGRDAKKTSIVSTIKASEQTILDAIAELKSLIVAEKKKPKRPPYL